MNEREPVLLTGSGGQFADALASLLDRAIRFPGTPGPEKGGDRSVRLRAEAESLPTLVSDLVAAALAAADDYDAALVDISVDGFRAVENGYRAWATAVVRPSLDSGPGASWIVGEPDVAEAVGIWTVSVRLVPE